MEMKIPSIELDIWLRSVEYVRAKLLTRGLTARWKFNDQIISDLLLKSLFYDYADISKKNWESIWKMSTSIFSILYLLSEANWEMSKYFSKNMIFVHQISSLLSRLILFGIRIQCQSDVLLCLRISSTDCNDRVLYCNGEG